MPLEGLGQVALIGKSARSCHLNQGQFSRFEQTLRSLEALVQHELMWACSRRVTKQASKVVGAEAGLLSQGLQREILIEVRLNIV